MLWVSSALLRDQLPDEMFLRYCASCVCSHSPTMISSNLAL